MNTELTPPGEGDLIELDRDHPGFRDPVYRARRNEIAALARAHVPGAPAPYVAYTPEEHGVWRTVGRHLAPLHRERVARELLELQLDLGSARIPQLEELNAALARRSGVRLQPVAGLVSARRFLEHLGRGVFLSTQYIRHASRPFYTPEPDVVHELVGHAASLGHAGIGEVGRLFGAAAAGADDEQLQRLERVYWYTLEFGLVREGRELKAVGAGLLSSCAELEQFDTGPELLDCDLDAIARTSYDPTDLQPQLFVAPSFARLIADLTAWLHCGRWRSAHASRASA